MEDTHSHSSGSLEAPAGVNDIIESTFVEKFTEFTDNESKHFKNCTKEHTIQTVSRVPKLGLMLVGIGGNNGTTLTASLMAHRKNISWETKMGIQKPTYHGSFTQCATAHVGFKVNTKTNQMEDVHMPVKDILPMVDPVDIEINGWDISGANLYEASKRARVLEPDLLKQLKGDLEKIKPLPAAFQGDFIAANQSDRANNILTGNTRE